MKNQNNKKNSHFNQEEREKLIVKYASLVKHIAGRMALRMPASVVFDDLISAGCVGLIDAIDKYDVSREVELKTYAEYRIKGAILDDLRSIDWCSRSVRKFIKDIEKAVVAVERHHKRPAKDREIAQELGLSLDDYYAVLSKINGSKLLNLDDYIKDSSNATYAKLSFKNGIKSTDDPVKNVHKEELKHVIANAIKSLSKKEQMVISLYYYDELTLKEIGQVLELTESRICQIHSLVLIKLKSKLKEYYEE